MGVFLGNMEWHTFSGEVRTNNSQKKRENMKKDSGEASCPVLLGARCLPENHQSTKEMDTLSFQFQLHGDRYSRETRTSNRQKRSQEAQVQ